MSKPHVENPNYTGTHALAASDAESDVAMLGILRMIVTSINAMPPKRRKAVQSKAKKIFGGLA